MKLRIPILMLLIPLMLPSSCKKTQDQLRVINMDFKSLVMRDINANPVGITGDPSDQFRNEDWPDWIHAHFKDMDTAFLPAGPGEAPQDIILFPNPAQTAQYLAVNISDTANLKVIMINTKGDCVLKMSRTITGGSYQTLMLPFHEAHVTKNNHYRLYYAFSVREYPFFNKGHANLLLN